MANDCRCNGGSSSFLSFMVGAAIGGGLALLLAPRSGEETRKQATDLAEDLKTKVRDIVDDAESRIHEVIDEGRETMEDKKDIIASAIAAGKEAFEEARKKQEQAPEEA